MSDSDSLASRLLAAAAKVRERAYCPYSGYAVGAALLSSDGRIYTGCNVENAAYPDCCCAERIAIYNAISDGCRSFSAIALVGGKLGEKSCGQCVPCGSCRQVMQEFCGSDFRIITMDAEFSLGELLPNGFTANTIS